MAAVERYLPRSAGERMAIGAVSLFCVVIFGGGSLVVILTPMPPLGAAGTIALIVAKQLFLATTMVAFLGILWAVATPRWVEIVFRFVWAKLLWVIGLSVVSTLVIFIVLACQK